MPRSTAHRLPIVAQIIAAQRLRVAGLSKAVKALQQEKKDLSEELSLIREVSNRGSATPTAQHVTRKPAGALTRARVRESELLGELKRLREESRAAERSRGLAEAREKLIAELRARGREREEEARQLRKEREDLRGERADLEKEVKASRAEAERLAQRNHGLVERMGKMADTLSRSTDEIETLRGQLAEAEAAVEQFRWHRDATEQGRQEALREVARLRGVVRKLAGRAREAGGGLAGGQADAGVCVDVDVDVTATAGGAAGCGGVGGQPPTTRRDAGSGEARPGRSGAEMLSEAFEEVGRAFGGLGTERAAVRGEGGPEAGCGGSRREFLSWNAEREGWGAASRAPTEAEEGRGARAGVPLRWEGARGARGEAWKRVGGVERDGMAEEDEVEEEWEEESMSFSDD